MVLTKSPPLGVIQHAVALAAIASVLSACGGASSTVAPIPSTPQLSALNVTVGAPVLHVGEVTTAGASGRDQFGNAFAIGALDWTTAAPAIATISATGVVSAISPGETTVMATTDGKHGQFYLRVLPTPVAIVSINPLTATLTLGSTQQLTATVSNDSGRVLTGRNVIWNSPDSAEAIVSASGLVTAVAAGSVSITATCEGITSTAVIVVPGAAGSVSAVTVTPSAATVQVGATTQLAAILKDASGNTLTGRVVNWTADVVTGSASVASVSATGLVTGNSLGIVTIEATSEGQRGTATVTVTAAVNPAIIVNFAEPVAGELVGDSLLVMAGVTSSEPLSTVVASVGSARAPLVLMHVGALGGSILWVGHVDLTELKSGPYSVVVTATDTSGAIGVGTIGFQRDARVVKAGTPVPPREKSLSGAGRSPPPPNEKSTSGGGKPIAP